METNLAGDETWRDCEFCVSSDTGPIQRRPQHYAPGEGHAIEPGEWPYARVVQLDDEWFAVWDSEHDDGRPYLFCPYHARGERVPRPAELAIVGDVEVNLQEFDYIMTRAPDIVMFKHIRTQRYLNLAERNGRAVWCDFDPKNGIVERDVDQGFRYARNSP